MEHEVIATSSDIIHFSYLETNRNHGELCDTMTQWRAHDYYSEVSSIYFLAKMDDETMGYHVVVDADDDSSLRVRLSTKSFI